MEFGRLKDGMAKIDGNIHIIPHDGEIHTENAYCWCNPKWDEINKQQFESWEAHTKVYIHKTRKELEQ